MISAMGDLEGKGKGGFVLLDEDFKVRACLSSSHTRQHIICRPYKKVVTVLPSRVLYDAGEGSMVRHDYRIWL